MVQKLRAAWPLLRPALGRAPPTRILEVNAAEALVHRCRLLARPLAAWQRLAAIWTDGLSGFHGSFEYAIEGALHLLMGEPATRRTLYHHHSPPALLAGWAKKPTGQADTNNTRRKRMRREAINWKKKR